MKLIAVAEEANPMCSAVFDPSNCHAMLGIKTPNPGVIACTDVLLIGTGCNDNPVDGVLFELSCSILSLIPITNQTFCNDTPSAIPRLFTFNGVFGNVIGESNKDNGDCSALLTSCFITGDNGIHNQTAACVLGMSTSLFIPYQFRGSDCENISPINEVIEERPIFIERIQEATNNAKTFDDLVRQYFPRRWIVLLSATLGLLAGAFSGLWIFLSYIPNTISTILKIRSGVIPSLRDPNFIKHRKQLESTTKILGVMIWGAAFTTLFFTGIVAIIILLLFWEVTRPIVFQILGVVIGVVVTLAIKSILFVVFGKLNYAAFYRRRPLVNNISVVALEAWHLGLTVLFVVARLVSLLVAAALHAGRVDMSVLTESAGAIGPIDLDPLPASYRKDLLLADAHRHPFIERLGAMYLMKIKHGAKFATAAGSVWRLLFVFALMPWLRKYRIASEVDLPEELVLQEIGTKPDHQYKKKIEQLEKKVRALQRMSEVRSNLGEIDDESTVDSK
uniref:Uncharacterized protein n=3 Tax=Ditylum brightwellii TaxID=49249 RepID=A0A6V2KGM0_9STRA|mmetsp:Transcript_27402/g.41027  ORF Transcript_27402/g.41027 Transcript_27402/m.41027 type:complete len:505 (+) Transcript_27402:1168-2682(+)